MLLKFETNQKVKEFEQNKLIETLSSISQKVYACFIDRLENDKSFIEDPTFYDSSESEENVDT